MHQFIKSYLESIEMAKCEPEKIIIIEWKGNKMEEIETERRGNTRNSIQCEQELNVSHFSVSFSSQNSRHIGTKWYKTWKKTREIRLDKKVIKAANGQYKYRCLLWYMTMLVSVCHWMGATWVVDLAFSPFYYSRAPLVTCLLCLLCVWKPHSTVMWVINLVGSMFTNYH